MLGRGMRGADWLAADCLCALICTMQAPPHDQRPVDQRHSDQRHSDQRHSDLRPPWHRFSLSGFLVFVLGISVGLAVYRVEEATWPDALLACFSVWFVVGMGQSAWREYALLREAASTGPERWGSMVLVLKPLLAAGMVCAGLAIHFVLSSDRHVDFHFDVVLSDEFLFYSGIVLGYGELSQPSINVERRQSIARCIVEGAGALLALFWIALVTSHNGLVTALVEIAIRGMELDEPLTRDATGTWVALYTRTADRQFVLGGYIAGGLACTALLSATAIHVRLPGRRCAVGAWIVSMIVAWPFLAWCYAVALPQASPLVAAEAMHYLPSDLCVFAGVVLTAAVVFAVHGSAMASSRDSKSSNVALNDRALLHQRRAVQALFLCGTLWVVINEYFPRMSTDWSEWKSRMEWALADHALNVEGMARAAAVIVVVATFVRTFRQPQLGDQRPTIDPRRTAWLTLVWGSTLLAVAPLLLWFGSVIGV